MLHSVDIYLNLETLRERARVKDSALKDIENRGKHPDARLILREYVERLSRLHQAVREKLRDPLTVREALIEGAIQRFRTAYPDEKSVIGLAAVDRRPDQTWAAQSYLFQDMIDRRRKFLRRNRSLVNLRHVSSEPRPPPAPKKGSEVSQGSQH